MYSEREIYYDFITILLFVDYWDYYYTTTRLYHYRPGLLLHYFYYTISNSTVLHLYTLLHTIHNICVYIYIYTIYTWLTLVLERCWHLGSIDGDAKRRFNEQGVPRPIGTGVNKPSLRESFVLELSGPKWSACCRII